MQETWCPSISSLHVRIIVLVMSNAANQKLPLQNPASLLLDLLGLCTACCAVRTTTCPALHLVFASDGSVHSKLKHVVDALHLLAATLNVSCAHSLCYSLTLLRSHRSQALSLEEINAGTFRSKVRLETDEDERRCGTEVKDFGVPLQDEVSQVFWLQNFTRNIPCP